MRYGYAVLDDDEVFETSKKLFFSKVVDLDRLFVDVGDHHGNRWSRCFPFCRGSDTLMMQGYDCSGLSSEEMRDLLGKLRERGVPFLFAQGRGASQPNEEKKRGRKSKELDMALFAQLCEQLVNKEITKKEMAAVLGIAYATTAAPSA